MKYIKFFKIIGIILLVYILSKLNYNEVLNIFKELNIFYILLYLVTFFIYFVLKVFRWYYLNKKLTNNDMTFIQALYVSIETLYLGFVTPGKLGDLLKLYILKEKFNIPKGQSLISYIFDRFQDLFYVSLFSCIGLIIFFDLKNVEILLEIILFVMFIIYLLKSKLLSYACNRFSISYEYNINFKTEIYIFVINTLLFIFYGLQLFLLAKAINLNIDFHIIAFIGAITSIISLVPLTVMGLGFREGSYIVLLELYNVTKENAVILSFLDSIIFYIIFIFITQIFNKLYLAHKIKE